MIGLLCFDAQVRHRSSGAAYALKVMAKARVDKFRQKVNPRRRPKPVPPLHRLPMGANRPAGPALAPGYAMQDHAMNEKAILLELGHVSTIDLAAALLLVTRLMHLIGDGLLPALTSWLDCGRPPRRRPSCSACSQPARTATPSTC